MTKYVENTTAEEDVLYAAFGKLKAGKDPKKSLVIKELGILEGVVTAIAPSKKYGKTYRWKVKGEEKPIVVTGKQDLVNKMGHGGAKAAYVVKVNDIVRLTFLGTTQTQGGNTFYNFKVEVAQ